MGYRVGGPLVFGLRRELLDEGRQSKGFLTIGQRKALQTDRVRLRLGPQHEADIVRWIFHQFVVEQNADAQIARELNRAGIPHLNGKAWSDSIIHTILKNENYVGNLVHNRTSRRLGQKLVNNPVSLWIRSEAAIDPTVDKSLFTRAQKIMAERYVSLSEEQMLVRLRLLLSRKGKLNSNLINKTSGVPSSMSYCKHFGSLRKAYTLIGYEAPRDCNWIDTRKLWSDTVEAHASQVAHALRGGKRTQVRLDASNATVTVTGKTRITFLTARQETKRGPSHSPRWRLYNRRGVSGLLAVLRLGDKNNEIKDFLLLPASRIKASYLRISDPSLIGGAIRAETLPDLIAAIKDKLQAGRHSYAGFRG